jgi:GT2 family glycosyltransferase
MVMTREFFEAVRRFDAMRTCGLEDVELCIRCWLLGYFVIMVPYAEVAHWFKMARRLCVNTPAALLRMEIETLNVRREGAGWS